MEDIPFIENKDENSLPSSEKEKHETSLNVFYELLDVDEESFNSFKSRLIGAQGHARIWVHPLYIEQWPAIFNYSWGKESELEDAKKKMRDSFLKTIKSVSKNKDSSPLFIYESTDKMRETQELIAGLLDTNLEDLSNEGFMFFPTTSGGSTLDKDVMMHAYEAGGESDREIVEQYLNKVRLEESLFKLEAVQEKEMAGLFPEISKDPYLLATADEKIKESYTTKTLLNIDEKNELIRLFKQKNDVSDLDDVNLTLDLYSQIGLKSALISGAYFSSHKEYGLRGCAGRVAKILRDNQIPTDISSNIWPPKDLLRKSGVVLKETNKD